MATDANGEPVKRLLHIVVLHAITGEMTDNAFNVAYWTESGGDGTDEYGESWPSELLDFQNCQIFL
jgi:hypothetical protein